MQNVIGVTSLYAEERQQAMARVVSERRRVSVADLSAEFAVTTETVRRDLSHLERLGLVRRVHGGAVPSVSLATIESGLGERDLTNADLKDRIASAAVALLPPDGATVLLDAGSTTSRLAAAIPPERALVCFTHAVAVASRLVALPRVELHLLPGRVRPTTQAAVGADTVAALGRLRADVVVLGTNALDVDATAAGGHGLSTPDADEAAVKQALVAAADRVVVLADSSKLGRTATVRFATLEEVDVVVTDGGVDAETRRRLEDGGVEVVVA